MQPTLVYGFPQGSAIGLVAALEWLGAPYRLCRVDMLGEMRDPAYVRLNRRVETPVLITPQGRAVTETTAIAAWMEDRDLERRISFAPGSPQADHMRQWIGFANSSLTPAFTPLWVALESETADPTFRASLRDFGRQQVVHRLVQAEAMMGDAPYLVGERPSLADAVLAGVLRWTVFHAVADLDAYPRLAAWRARLEADPAVRAALALEAGEVPGEASGGVTASHVSLAALLAERAAAPPQPWDGA